MAVKGIRTAGTLAALGCLLIAGCGSSARSGKAAGSPSPAGSTHTDSAPGSAGSGGSGSGSPAPATTGSSGTPTTTPSKPAGPAGGPVPAGFVPYSVTFVSAEDGWVLGDAPCSKPPCTSILRTRDGGKSWQGAPAPKAALVGSQPKPDEIQTLRFANGSDGWAAGTSLYATHNGGATWTRVPVGPSGGFITSIGTAAGRVYASTATCTYQSSANCKPTQTVYSATTGSNSWSPVSSALPGYNPAGMVVIGSGWYLPLGPGIYHGQGTAAPVKLANPCPNTRGYGAPAATIAVADPLHLDAICRDGGAMGSSQYQLYGSTDGGRHWATAGAAQREASGLYGLADNAHGVLLAATASGRSQILRSTDDGRTLATARISAAGGGIMWADLGFTTSSQAVVVLSHTALYLSRDSGASWTAVRF